MLAIFCTYFFFLFKVPLTADKKHYLAATPRKSISRDIRPGSGAKKGARSSLRIDGNPLKSPVEALNERRRYLRSA